MSEDTDTDGALTDRVSSDLLKSFGIRLGVFLAIVGFLYLIRPAHHWISYRIMFQQEYTYLFGPVIIAAVVLILTPSSLITSRESPNSYFELVIGVLFTALVVGFLLSASLGWVGGLHSDSEIADRTMNSAQEVEEFPAVNPDNPRVVPRAVADVQTRGSVSYRQHQLGPSDIARTPSGAISWSYPIEPDQVRNRIQGNQRGVLLSDMTQTSDRTLEAYDTNQDFKYGTNHFLHRSADWNVKKTGYMSEYDEDFYGFVHDEEAYMAIPKISHEWRFTTHNGSIPLPRTVPVWNGIALIHQDGQIDHLSPSEAQNSEILDGQRLYPLKLADREARSLGYRNGVINQLPLVGLYEGVVEPADLPAGASNSQPFVIDMEGEQMSYVFAMEPDGETTRGLDEVWFFNSESGELQYYGSGGETLYGPERAMGLIRNEDTQTQWSSGDGSGSSGEFTVVEPVPTVINGELWWHAKVVSTDNTDVSRNSFVNARTEEVVELEDTEEVVKFISGADADELDMRNTTTEMSERGSVAYIVIRENGEVIDRVRLEEDYTYNVEYGNTTDSEDETNQITPISVVG